MEGATPKRSMQIMRENNNHYRKKPKVLPGMPENQKDGIPGAKKCQKKK